MKLFRRRSDRVLDLTKRYENSKLELKRLGLMN